MSISKDDTAGGKSSFQKTIESPGGRWNVLKVVFCSFLPSRLFDYVKHEMVPLTGHFSLEMRIVAYFRSWLIQLNRSYNYNGKIDRTGISTFNDHISEPESEKLKSLDPICFSILGLSFFRTFPQCIFRHFWAIFYHFLPFCN